MTVLGQAPIKVHVGVWCFGGWRVGEGFCIKQKSCYIMQALLCGMSPNGEPRATAENGLVLFGYLLQIHHIHRHQTSQNLHFISCMCKLIHSESKNLVYHINPDKWLADDWNVITLYFESIIPLDTFGRNLYPFTLCSIF